MDRVLVVDDEPGIRETVRAYLERDGFAVDEAADGPTALARAETGEYALVVLDLMLPGLSGREVCRRLRAESAVPVLMLTARSGPEAAAEGLDLGADDYMEKPFSPRELAARVRAVLRRARPPGSRLEFPGLSLDREGRTACRDGACVELTASEWRILEALALRPGRVFSREEIAARALGELWDGYERTIDAHVKNLRRKLDEDSENPRWIETVRGMGYRFRREP
ncbi:MAG TPA: response regulator transcription factor [Spirochaetia bacterium]|nr:response regulator transcription factor [Spirochaetales bacterium]HRY78951.1 response regulator transcription factor [Spirochaetia bacterium]HRZ88173.1 response regulator transcription factor [Spirochaetia bacterium]